MSQQEQKIQVEVARSLGWDAFHFGKNRVPAYDKEFLAMCEVIQSTQKVEFGFTIPLLKAWLDGWDAANLSLTAEV